MERFGWEGEEKITKNTYQITAEIAWIEVIGGNRLKNHDRSVQIRTKRDGHKTISKAV